MEEKLAQSRRRGRTLQYALIISVVLALALTAVVAMFYIEVVNQRDAGYRAQYATVLDVIRVAPVLNHTIHHMIYSHDLYYGNSSYERQVRFAYGDFAEGTLLQLSSECRSISALYDVGTERNSVFSNLSDSFAVFANAVHSGYSRLDCGFLELGSNYTSEMENASVTMVRICALLSDGVRPDVDGLENPYDVLAGIELAEVDHYSARVCIAASYAWHAFDLP